MNEAEADRALRAVSRTIIGSIHGLWMGVRHLRGRELSYLWIEAVIKPLFGDKGHGLPVRCVIKNNFTTPDDVASAWRWVLSETSRRGLNAAILDEQIWFAGALASEAELTKRLDDASKALAGPLVELDVMINNDERLGTQWAEVRGHFLGRPGSGRNSMALLASAADDTVLRVWVDRVKPT